VETVKIKKTFKYVCQYEGCSTECVAAGSSAKWCKVHARIVKLEQWRRRASETADRIKKERAIRYCQHDGCIKPCASQHPQAKWCEDHKAQIRSEKQEQLRKRKIREVTDGNGQVSKICKNPKCAKVYQGGYYSHLCPECREKRRRETEERLRQERLAIKKKIEVSGDIVDYKRKAVSAGSILKMSPEQVVKRFADWTNYKVDFI
jgi:hypothetical protein